VRSIRVYGERGQEVARRGEDKDARTQRVANIAMAINWWYNNLQFAANFCPKAIFEN
jgi:hypothetical protein